MPVVGFFAKMQQCIFFDRKNEEERKNVQNIINQRILDAEKGLYQPLLIFPEGTTTNGRAMMKFKRGAFELEKPFYVYSLYYHSKFVPCLNMIKPAPSNFIMLSLLSNNITYMKFSEPIDPLWIIKKHGRKPGQEGNWEIIAKEVKELMCFAFGLENDDMTFMEKCKFDCASQGITMEQLYARA